MESKSSTMPTFTLFQLLVYLSAFTSADTINHIARSQIFETAFKRCFHSSIENKSLVLDHDVKSQCTMFCLQDPKCTAACYNAGTKTCSLTFSGQKNMRSNIMTCEMCTLMWKSKGKHDFRNPKWKMLFRGTKNIILPVHSLFMMDNLRNQDAKLCQSINTTACPSHYRSSFIDKWKELVIFQVKVELYKKGKKVAYLKFGGFPNYDNVSKSTWFKPEFLQDSSWSDLNKHINSSTLNGNVDVGKNNKFDVTTYNNCSKMWFMIADSKNNNCFNIPNSNLLQPFFVYSTKGTHANSPGDVGFADVLAIYGDVET
ncbi:Hypothetical predicted protein [Mytilus galloprovincialis]|uniref:Apple domain-containing protein n=1 Tax=Mytilus galloprovincialis TaxID=29158 RepID=A0A8B6BZR7_MYTGA|nr:Hypothetical predicted protein [Mytilus galloprovincialis]